VLRCSVTGDSSPLFFPSENYANGSAYSARVLAPESFVRVYVGGPANGGLSAPTRLA